MRFPGDGEYEVVVLFDDPLHSDSGIVPVDEGDLVLRRVDFNELLISIEADLILSHLSYD